MLKNPSTTNVEVTYSMVEFRSFLHFEIRPLINVPPSVMVVPQEKAHSYPPLECICSHLAKTCHMNFRNTTLLTLLLHQHSTPAIEFTNTMKTRKKHPGKKCITLFVPVMWITTTCILIPDFSFNHYVHLKQAIFGVSICISDRVFIKLVFDE
ncbi:hypothetical protein XELAEV_18000420mg [Xenopus laevis]|uniref:Uncharacterized protein n=1 Tax=Xenopus laevis TaxID=8355 RepID=A0A974BPH6_XENLA|nr:hypothetical protein XELAEV_18000420mg [Xenopus laevis]